MNTTQGYMTYAVSPKPETNPMRPLWWLILLIPIVAVAVWAIVVACELLIPPNVTAFGVFGDSFGILSALFNGLAFAGLIITILLQREELQLQRAELAGQREEMSKLAAAQAASEQALREQARLSALAALVQAEVAQQHNRAMNYRLLEEVQVALRTSLAEAGVDLHGR
jgi:hypothetical protein